MKNITDFQLKARPESSLVEKYRPVVPEKLIAFWDEYGFGAIADGYLKIVNPDDFELLLKEVYAPVFKNPVVMFATGLCDLIIWENNYAVLLNLRHRLSKVIESGFQYFLEDIYDKDFINDELDGENYFKAQKQLGEIVFDECYGYVPLLGLGGAENVENLQKVKIPEHISVIAQALGKIK